ncbi:MAG: ABC transporter permease [Cytophagales bacterium]|nr:ABC transporter permease [Cytophagales bacterium]
MSKSNKPYLPPRWLDQILKVCCDPDQLEEIMGNLHERYQLRKVRSSNKVMLFWFYFREVLAYLRPQFSRRIRIDNPNHLTMIERHLKTSTRSILRNKTLSLINIGGLALGITCFLCLYLWIDAETSVNKFHKHAEELYTVYFTETTPQGKYGNYEIPFNYVDTNMDGSKILANELKAQFPEIREATTYATSYELPWGHACTFRLKDKRQKFEGSVAGPGFFRLFSFPLLAGDPETALSTRSGIAISRSMAESFFDSHSDAMGQTLRYENVRDFVITAVFEDVKDNSSLQFDYLINWDLTHNDNILLSSSGINTFLLLEKSASPEALQAKLQDFLQDRLNSWEMDVTLGIQPFKDQYLISNFVEGKPLNGRIEYIRIFSVVAFFILLVACINFMNLVTAQSIKKAKEMSIRKVIGSSRYSLIMQSLTESILMTVIAMILALMLTWNFQPIISEITGKHLIMPLHLASFWTLILMLVVSIGCVSGFYPALFLSSVKPNLVLQRNSKPKGKSAWLQKGLVILQFSISMLLMVATIVVSRQTHFIQNTHLGYDKENLIAVRIEGKLTERQQYLLLKQELQQMPGIQLVDRSSEAPHNMGFEMMPPFEWQGQAKGEGVSFLPTSVGYDFVEIMNLQIKEGRNFDRRIASDSTAFMVNEIALKQMNMTDPIGKWISAWDKRGPIIGILKDYHASSLHDPIKPLIVDVKEDLDFGLILVKTQPGATIEALSSMEKAFQEFNPNFPLAYSFVDDEYSALYNSEMIINKLSNAFASLAMVISCLGLLGLAISAAASRIKEMGIRKVLGASVSNILTLFSSGFLRLIATAFLIATPVSWWLLNTWLDGFAYRVHLSWWIFIVTGLITLVLALLTIGIQAMKTAASNPVTALRSE